MKRIGSLSNSTETWTRIVGIYLSCVIFRAFVPPWLWGRHLVFFLDFPFFHALALCALYLSYIVAHHRETLAKNGSPVYISAGRLISLFVYIQIASLLLKFTLSMAISSELGILKTILLFLAALTGNPSSFDAFSGLLLPVEWFFSPDEVTASWNPLFLTVQLFCLALEMAYRSAKIYLFVYTALFVSLKIDKHLRRTFTIIVAILIHPALISLLTFAFLKPFGMPDLRPIYPGATISFLLLIVGLCIGHIWLGKKMKRLVFESFSNESVHTTNKAGD